MKVTRTYRGWFFPIEKAVKTVLLGELGFFLAFLSYFFVDDIEMVGRVGFFLELLLFWVPSISY